MNSRSRSVGTRLHLALARPSLRTVKLRGPHVRALREIAEEVLAELQVELFLRCSGCATVYDYSWRLPMSVWHFAMCGKLLDSSHSHSEITIDWCNSAVLI